jgi:multiple sugar transport system permease protein
MAGIFIWPTMLILITYAIFPLFWSLYLSFTRYSVTVAKAPVWIGTKNYVSVLSDKLYWGSFKTTAGFTLGAVLLEFLLGFTLAYILSRRFRGSGVLTTLFLLPMMLAPVVVGLFWKFMYNGSWGIIPYMLSVVGISDPGFLTSPKTALFSIILVDTWMWTPFMMLFSLAGLTAVPQYLYEAAEIDRASEWFKLRHITLPLVWPLLLIALIFRMVEAFKIFDLPYIITGGGPGRITETISISLYKLAFSAFDTGKGSAFGYIILVIIIALANLLVLALNRASQQK